MTDDELQQYAQQVVRIRLSGKEVTGKLLTGFEAQLRVDSPYAIEWHDLNPTLGTKEERLVAIPSAEIVESIELVNEAAAAEAQTESIDQDAQTPG
jgi:hypothetical protein